MTQNKTAYTNIGNTLNFVVNSYIHGENDIGLPGLAGDKLTTTFSLTGNYDDKGNFKGFSTSMERETGKTFGFISGEERVDANPNQDGYVNTLSDGTVVAGFEQHTEVNKLEKPGLLALHGRIVDVAQDLTIKVGKGGKLSATVMHGTFPSIDVKMNGVVVYQFRQHSFLLSHSLSTDRSSWRYSAVSAAKGQFFQNSSDQINLINRSKQAPYINFGNFDAGVVNPNKYSGIPW